MGVLTTMLAALFLHEALKSLFSPYKRFCLDAWDWLTLPYLIAKVFRYSDNDLLSLRVYTRRVKQRPPIVVMRWVVERICSRRGI